jgi:hypothetical protein
MSDWQPIESAPKDGTRVLGYFPDLESGYHDTVWIDRLKTWVSRAYPAAPSHWMPLPPPPGSET